MSLARSWQFIGPVGSVWYRCYDRLRRGVNRRLVGFLAAALPHEASDGSGGATERPGRRRVLEAGSGTAFASSVMADRLGVSRSVCLDIDPEPLRHARERDQRVWAVVGDLRRMPFADGAFVLVFNSSTVEHLDDPVPAVCEMHRVCAAAGRVFVGVPYALGPLCFQPVLAGTRVGTWLGPVFTRASLDGMLRQAGLTPVEHLRYFWRFFIGALAVKPNDSDGRAVGARGPC